MEILYETYIYFVDELWMNFGWSLNDIAGMKLWELSLNNIRAKNILRKLLSQTMIKTIIRKNIQWKNIHEGCCAMRGFSEKIVCENVRRYTEMRTLKPKKLRVAVQKKRT